MRIIAGDFKGRRLQTPKGNDIRPTSDKVKEAIFNTIAPYLEEAVVIDLFTGTGNLGLEALSRDAKKCFFCDKSRTSLMLAKDNAEYCKALDKSVFLLGDYQISLRKIKEKADIIFMDPPYGEGLIIKAMEVASELELLNEDGIIVAEHGIREILPDEMFGFTKIKEKRYGSIVLSVFTDGGN